MSYQNLPNSIPEEEEEEEDIVHHKYKTFGKAFTYSYAMIQFISLLFALIFDKTQYENSIRELVLFYMVTIFIYYQFKLIKWTKKFGEYKKPIKLFIMIFRFLCFLTNFILFFNWAFEKPVNKPLYVAVGVFILIDTTLYVLVTCAFCCICGYISIRYVGANREEQERLNQRKATVSMIQDLTDTKIFSKLMEDTKIKEPMCCICLRNFTPEDEVRILKCQHYFHKECIMEWLNREKSCPYCRRDIDAICTEV